MTRPTPPNWLMDDDGRYVPGEEAVPCEACGGHFERPVPMVDQPPSMVAPWHWTTVECAYCLSGWFDEHGTPLQRARCTACEGPIPDDAPRPLCRKHDAAYRAGGRSEDERARQERAAAGA